MKAQWFSFCSPRSGFPIPMYVVWVPEEQVQFQWIHPPGAIQVVHTPHPVPPDAFGSLVPVCEEECPHGLMRETRRYLKAQKHQRAEAISLQRARNRVTEAAKRNESQMQAIARIYLQDRPDTEKGRGSK
mgnify:FL=1